VNDEYGSTAATTTSGEWRLLRRQEDDVHELSSWMPPKSSVQPVDMLKYMDDFHPILWNALTLDDEVSACLNGFIYSKANVQFSNP